MPLPAGPTHGTARLLASTGTGQLLLALRTAPALGEKPGEVPGSGWTPVLDDAATAQVPSGVRAVRAGDRPDAAASLQAVLDAEFGAAYAYEVAQAQVGAGFTVVGQAPAERREAHLEAGGEGTGLLPALCLPELTPVPAYSLAPEFMTDPLGSLSLLEEGMPTLYANLAGSSDGAVRSWAIDRLVASSVLLYSGAGEIPASPGWTRSRRPCPGPPGSFRLPGPPQDGRSRSPQPGRVHAPARSGT